MSNVEDLGLNDKAIREFGNGTPFLPWGNGRYTAIVQSIVFKPSQMGQSAWHCNVLILDSDRADVCAGDVRSLYMPIGGDAIKSTYSLKRLRAIVAAMKGRDPSDPTFDANAAVAEYRALGEDLESLGIALTIVATDRTTNKGARVTEYYFQLATGAAG